MVNLSHLKINPLPFQREGIQFLQDCNGTAYIGDDPGLGKTLQVIAYTSANNFRTLVVCPSYLKYNWQNEIQKFTNCSSTLVTSVTSGNFDYYIVNYDIIINPVIQSVLRKFQFDCLVCDESHYLMNAEAQRTTAIKLISQNIPRTICMSGTPIKSRPEEFFVQLQLLHPEIQEFSNQRLFQYRFCNAPKVKLGSIGFEEENPELSNLHRKIGSFFLRRTKAEVLPQLPKKTLIPIAIDLPDEFKSGTLDQQHDPLAFINYTKQFLSMVKTHLVIQHIDDLLKKDQKVIVFSQYTRTIKLLADYYESLAVVHRGQMSAKKKQIAIDAFQKDPNTKVLIGNIATAVGYNATVSCNVVYVDLPWTPADIMQSADRSHRIGQENPVSVYVFYYKDSIEEDIYNMLYAKQKIFDQVVEGTLDTEETLSIQQMIMRKLKVA